MKRIILLSCLVLPTLMLFGQIKKTTKHISKAVVASGSSAAMKTQLDSLSFALGLSFSQYIKAQGITNINYDLFTKAIDQTLKGKPSSMDMNTASQVMSKFIESKHKNMASEEKEKGKIFLDKNRMRPEVLHTASGLQYEVLVKGTGAIPTGQDTVSAHYKGTLLNGKEFDNSYARNMPLTIPVSSVIPGWTEALKLMPVGSKWKLYIPSDLAYGDRGAGKDIPGGSTLIFEIELLGISHKK